MQNSCREEIPAIIPVIQLISTVDSEGAVVGVFIGETNSAILALVTL